MIGVDRETIVAVAIERKMESIVDRAMGFKNADSTIERTGVNEG